MRFFRKRAFSAANATSLLMSFGMFGAIFLLAQFFQIVQGYSPLEAGLRTLPWTAMPILVAPIAGILSDRIGARPLLVAGMALMAVGLGWIAVITSPTVAYGRLVPAFVMAGIGMSLYFAPVANLVLSTVRRNEEGKACGVNNTVREVGGVFGVAVLASVFSAAGGYATPQSFVDGMVPAIWVGAVAVGHRRRSPRSRSRRARTWCTTRCRCSSGRTAKVPRRARRRRLPDERETPAQGCGRPEGPPAP